MYTIVLVDDESEIRNGLANFFPWSTIGCEVVYKATNGLDAYNYLKTNAVDIVLSDIIMDDMTGLELAKKIQKEKINTKVVLMSAYEEFEYAKQAIQYGVRMYVKKAMHFDELMSALMELTAELEMEKKTPTPIPYMSYNQKLAEKVKAYIDENYGHATLSTAATYLKMNADYIGKFFKKTTGITFSEYLSKVRMENAKVFLLDVDNSIYDVSEMVGYSNQFNFARAFKNYCGVSPRTYRQHGGAGDTEQTNK